MGCCRRVSSIVCDCRRMYTLPNKTQLDKLGTISGPLPSRFLTLGMQIDAGVCKSGAGFGQLALGNRFVANTLHIQQTETFALVALVHVQLLKFIIHNSTALRCGLSALVSLRGDELRAFILIVGPCLSHSSIFHNLIFHLVLVFCSSACL